MSKVIIESPYAGDVEKNVEYARRCMRDSLMRGEAPYASHLLYTQKGILDDDNPDERRLGIDSGLMWGVHADKTVVYDDYGITEGMRYGINEAKRVGRVIQYRQIGNLNAFGKKK